MAAGFVNTTIYVGPTTTITQSIWDTVGDGSGNKIPGFLKRDASGNVEPAGDAATRPIYVLPTPIVSPIPSANFTRPADTTAYASGDLVANNTAAGSVVPLSWANLPRSSGGAVQVRRARVKKTNTGVTNAQFRLHLYGASPTVTNGDNGAWLSTQSTYLGSIDVTIDKAFSDAAEGCGVPQSNTGTEINIVCSATTIYGLLEARAAYTPGSAETFTVELEVFQF